MWLIVNQLVTLLVVLGVILVASGSTQIVLEVNQTQQEVENLFNLKDVRVRIVVENITVTDKLIVTGYVNLTLSRFFHGRLYVEVKWGNLSLYNVSIGPQGWKNHYFKYSIPLKVLEEHRGENLTIIARYSGRHIGLKVVSKTYKLSQLAEFFRLLKVHVDSTRLNDSHIKIIVTITSRTPINKMPLNIMIGEEEYQEVVDLSSRKARLIYTVNDTVDYIRVSIPYINYTLYEGVVES